MQQIEAPSPEMWARLRELLAEAEAFDGNAPISDQALIAVQQGRRKIYASDDALGITGEGELDLVVRPSARGKGIGGEALTTLLEAEDRRARSELRAWAHGENPAAEALLQDKGFEPVRELLRMALDPAKLHAALEAARAIPEGFEIAAYDPVTEPSQAADWVRVNAAAFAGHPEQGAMTLGDFELLEQESWFDPSDLRLAWAARSSPRVLAGFAWVKTTRGEHGAETELYAIGVDPAFAGLGLGAALLGETLRRMALHRPDRITLYVDGDNTGAIALYERAGFEVERRSTQWRRASH